MNIEEAIVLWLNNIDFITHHIDNFEQLSDGVLFTQLLNAVDPTFFSMECAKQLLLTGQKDEHQIQKLLVELIEKITQYRQNIQCKPAELAYINVLEIVTQNSRQQILQLFELILKLVLSSPLKSQMIKPILSLDEKTQELLMHCLKKHLDEDMTIREEDDWPTGNNLNDLLGKMDEIENDNMRLNEINYEYREQIKDLELKVSLLEQQYERKDLECKALVEQRVQYEKFFEDRNAITQGQQEDEKIRQKCLEQEHRIASLELSLDDYKKQESQHQSLKEEHEHLKLQNRKYNQMETQLEALRERRELDKDVLDQLKEKYEKEAKYLKQNLKDVLQEQFELKEKKLNLELELQQKQAKVDKYQQQVQSIEQEYKQKITEMEELMHSLRQADIKEAQVEVVKDETMDKDMMINRLASSKNENIELEYYIKENHKMEERIKELQRQLNDVQFELDSRNSKRELETQVIQAQQIQMLHDKLKKTTEHNEQLKKSNEEMKKLTQVKKVTQLDYDIGILQILQEALSKKVYDIKNKPGQQ